MTTDKGATEQPTTAEQVTFEGSVNGAINAMATQLMRYLSIDKTLAHPQSLALGVNAQEAKFDALFHLLIHKGIITRAEYENAVLVGLAGHTEGLKSATEELTHRPVIAVAAGRRN